MARSAQVTVENNFTKGLITEATAMAFPENAVVETDNCDYSSRGVVTRRLGVDYEANSVVINASTITTNTGAINEFIWKTVGENASVDFVVQQLAEKLIFFTTDETGLSQNLKAFEIDLLDYKVAAWTDAQVYETPCSFATGTGRLFVTNPFCEPFYVDYDFTLDTITVTEIVIKIRDFAGVDDGLEVDERPAVITAAHQYNLYNQGWYATNIGMSSGPNDAPYLKWETTRADYPSNSDVWWLLKNASGYFDITWPQKAVTTAKAPNGHYIFNAFNVDRASIIATTTNDTTDNRPSCVEFFAGRVFYSGVNDKDYSSRIYFSKILNGVVSAGECYQNGDPTSEDFFELVASDGGVITIAAAGKIHKLVAFNAGLLVLAENGVWSITGTSTESFTPTTYTVTKINDIGIISQLPVTSVEGVPVWVNYEGIFTVKASQLSNTPEVVSLTRDTIQAYFDRIPKDNLPYIKGAYNSTEKRVMWLYRLAARTDAKHKYEYDNILVLDRVSGAFYNYSFDITVAPKLSGLLVVLGRDIDDKLTYVFKFFTTGFIGTADVYGIAYSQLNNSTYQDWFTHSPTSFDSYFITGYRVRGELLKKFQSNYLMVLTSDALAGSCLVQGLWDYTNTTDNGRYTTSQEVYRPDSTYNYHRCKLKIRGSGYSLQFKFRSNGNNPFEIIGWSTFETGNNVP